jgi:hypothetical protein
MATVEVFETSSTPAGVSCDRMTMRYAHDVYCNLLVSLETCNSPAGTAFMLRGRHHPDTNAIRQLEQRLREAENIALTHMWIWVARGLNKVISQGRCHTFSCGNRGVKKYTWLPVKFGNIPAEGPRSTSWGSITSVTLLASRDSSVGISLGYGLYCRRSIPGCGKRFFSSLQRSDWFWSPPKLIQWVPQAPSPAYSHRSVKLSTHLYLVSRWRIVELYLHFFVFLHGMVFN